MSHLLAGISACQELSLWTTTLGPSPKHICFKCQTNFSFTVQLIKCIQYTGLGIRSFDFRANHLFFAQK